VSAQASYAPAGPVRHLRGTTFHGRKGPVANRFSYAVDYLLIAPEARQPAPWLFRRNRAGLVSLQDVDHGGTPGKGRGAAWLREVLKAAGLDQLRDARITLLAQPRVLGHVFNPVSFWFVQDDAGLRAVLAEVSNTFGDRHSYLCHHDDLRPIAPQDSLGARKVFHVSPFQPVEGAYRFRFGVTDTRVDIHIDYDPPGGGLVATLHGPLRPLTTRGLAGMLLRRPLGSRRVLALIHWQALKLWLKGAGYRRRPAPPESEVS